MRIDYEDGIPMKMDGRPIIFTTGVKNTGGEILDGYSPMEVKKIATDIYRDQVIVTVQLLPLIPVISGIISQIDEFKGENCD